MFGQGIEGPPPEGGGRRLSKGEAERLFYMEMLAEMRRLCATTTEGFARLTGRSVNNVLDVQTQPIPTAGYIQLTYGTAAGAIEVSNLSAGTGTVTVHASGPAGSAPTYGIGVYRVAPGATRTISVDSHQITIYGTAADVVCWQVWSKGADPVA